MGHDALTRRCLWTALDPGENGCAERFIRTLNEQGFWVEHFTGVEELRWALLAFQERYNREWLIARHGHRTPAAVRAAFATEVVASLSSAVSVQVPTPALAEIRANLAPPIDYQCSPGRFARILGRQTA